MLRFSTNIRRFRPETRNRRQLPFPAAPHLRVAQLGGAVSAFGAVQSFSHEQWYELEGFHPQVLMGSPSDLRRVAELAERGVIDLGDLDRAVFALTRCGDAPVNDVVRVVLWQAFGVPVYEVFVGSGGSLLASECEAHEGWHIEPSAKFAAVKGEIVLDMPGRPAIATGLTGRVEVELCSCGRPGARLIEVEALPLMRVRRALAATA